ncbi:MAG: hypothetical protein EOM07_05155 [Clostridia bacterium]|nr:hypothetical protein [Clostridia bacterium]
MLKDKAKKINSNGGVAFMDRREKAELILDETLLVDDFGFIKGEDGEYVVLSTKDYPKFFFFGGSVVTQKFKELIDGENLDDIKEKLEAEGLPTLFTKKTTKKGNRSYTTCVFYPEEEA